MKNKAIRTKMLVLVIFIFQACLSYAQTNDTKKLLIGKWTTTKVESSPEVQKEYNDWKQKINTTTDENEKAILKTNIEGYESVLEAFNGMCTEFKQDDSCIMEVPNFSSTEPKLAIKGKWQLSADHKTVTVTTKDKKTEYQIGTLNEKEFTYNVGKGPGMRIFHLKKI
jgi:ABC-type oligopeptide transport system substrate-binding subunit